MAVWMYILWLWIVFLHSKNCHLNMLFHNSFSPSNIFIFVSGKPPILVLLRFYSSSWHPCDESRENMHKMNQVDTKNPPFLPAVTDTPQCVFRTRRGGSKTCYSKCFTSISNLFEVRCWVFSVWTRHLTSTYFSAFARHLTNHDCGCCKPVTCTPVCACSRALLRNG